MLNFATRLSADRCQLFWASAVNRLKEVLLVKFVLKQGYPVDSCGTGVRFPKDAFLLHSATVDGDPPILLSNAYRELFPLGVRRLGHDVEPLRPLLLRLYVELYLHSPICLHGLVP